MDNSDIAKQDATEAAAQARVDVDDEYIMVSELRMCVCVCVPNIDESRAA